jgi:hypothetical protein
MCGIAKCKVMRSGNCGSLRTAAMAQAGYGPANSQTLPHALPFIR